MNGPPAGTDPFRTTRPQGRQAQAKSGRWSSSVSLVAEVPMHPAETGYPEPFIGLSCFAAQLEVEGDETSQVLRSRRCARERCVTLLQHDMSERFRFRKIF